MHHYLFYLLNFCAVFNIISVESNRQLTYPGVFSVAPVLGHDSEVSCPLTLPRKLDPVRLEARSQVLHFTFDPGRTVFCSIRAVVLEQRF